MSATTDVPRDPPVFTDLAWTKFERLVSDRGGPGCTTEKAIARLKEYRAREDRWASCRWLICGESDEAFSMQATFISSKTMLVLLMKRGIVHEVVSFRGLRQVHKLFKHWAAGSFTTTQWSLVEALRSERRVVRVGSGLIRQERNPRDRHRDTPRTEAEESEIG